MANPIVVEATRGALVESTHRGAGAVVDARGVVAFAFGDVERAVFPRSAVKAFQALPLVESGAADKLGLTDAEIALACASHGGEAEHVAGVETMLAKVGLDARALACGVHWPLNGKAARALARAGEGPTALHNNCSGKHAGFLCLSCASGWSAIGYLAADHPAQQAARAAIAELVGAPLGADVCAIDGCSIPTYAAPLQALALGFARFGAGEGLAPAREKATRRIRAAVAAHPVMIAGEGRFDTEAMTLFGERLFVKAGAEGVHCAALPDLGLGLAVKADDGAARAAQAMIAALIARFLPMSEAERGHFAEYVAPRIANWSGLEVGALRPTGALG